jgi:hypothetical protein
MINQRMLPQPKVGAAIIGTSDDHYNPDNESLYGESEEVGGFSFLH